MLAYFSALNWHFSLVNQNIRNFSDGRNTYKNVGDCVYPHILTKEGWTAAAEHWVIYPCLPECEERPIKKEVLVTYI